MIQELNSSIPGNLEFQIARRRNVVSDSTMKRFPSKIMALINAKGTSKARVARSIDADESQFGKWTTGKLTPSAEQILAIARAFEITMDYFVDDEIEEMPAEGQSVVVLTKDERYVIDLFRVLRLGKDEAARLWAGRAEQPESIDAQPGSADTGKTIIPKNNLPDAPTRKKSVN